jgi:hypothetical protein
MRETGREHWRGLVWTCSLMIAVRRRSARQNHRLNLCLKLVVLREAIRLSSGQSSSAKNRQCIRQRNARKRPSTWRGILDAHTLRSVVIFFVIPPSARDFRAFAFPAEWWTPTETKHRQIETEEERKGRERARATATEAAKKADLRCLPTCTDFFH